MSNVFVLKCPADFCLLGQNEHAPQRTIYRQWQYLERSRLTAEVIAACAEYISSPVYSPRFVERFCEAAGEAIPFVSHRTRLGAPVNIGLICLTILGQRHAILTVDGLPPPGLRLDLPDPNDPSLRHPAWGAIDPARPSLIPYFTHARIWGQVDGYLIIHDPEVVLQLELTWSEPISSAARTAE